MIRVCVCKKQKKSSQMIFEIPALGEVRPLHVPCHREGN